MLIVAVIVGGLYYYDAHPISGMVDSGGVLAVLFMPLVVTLSIGAGSLPALLSTRAMIYGGQISFSLYMIHEPVHTAWNWAAQEYRLALPMWGMKLVVIGLIAAALALSALLFHVVEEPARRWMRSMVDVRDVKTGSSDGPKGRLQAVEDDGPSRASA